MSVSTTRRGSFWSERKVAWYRRANARSEYLRGFLAERLTREGSGWLAPFRKRAAVIQSLAAERKDAP